MRRCHSLTVAALLGTLGVQPPARACSIAVPTPHVVDPAMQATDHVPPTLPPLGAPRITRGKPPQRSGCGYSGTSCDDLGSVVIPLGATDDQTPPTQIGFRMSLAAGALPSGLSLPSDAVKPWGDVLALNWPDGANDDQEPIDFTLRVVAIDLAGNESPPQTVRVADDPGGAGCVVARPGTAPEGAAGVAIGALLLVVRRRSRRGPR